jgi:peptidoglycan-associated lipoprotein
MYQTSRAVGSFLLIVYVVAVGCSRKRVSPTPPAPVDRGANDTGARRDSIARAEAARHDSLARETRLREAREKRLAEARATLATPVYFAYDRSDLSSEARERLDAKASIMNGSPSLRLRLAGHTDERGSDEYNLALGQRRAARALEYLTALGVPAARLEITSFGEEKPMCQESTESCWSRNRRVEFEIVAGADLIVVQ